MKNLFTVLFLIFGLFGFSQIPQQINYQGIARDSAGLPIVSQAIGLKFEIKTGSSASTAVYTETQTVNTNVLGLFSTQIGKSTSGITGVDWSTGSVFLEIYLDATNSGSYTELGVQQLYSVPFALAAPSPTLDYTNNVLTVGDNTVGIAAGSSTAVTVTAGANVSVSAGPDYTISAITPSLVLFNGNLSISGSTATVPYPSSVPLTTLTPSGLVAITGLGTNTFNVNVPTPTYNNNLGILSFGSNTTNITQGLVLLPNGVLSAGPSSNSVALPSGVTVAGSGIASISGGPAYTVNVSNPLLNLSGNVLSAGSPTNFVTLPSAFPQGSLTATSGLVNITSVGINTFNINVPIPTYASGTGILSFGANTVSVTPALNLASGILSSGPSTNSVNLSNSGPFRQSVGSVTLATSTDNVAIGPNAATAKLDVQGNNATTSSILRVINSNGANTSNILDIATNGGTALNISNTSASGIAGSFNSIGTSLSTQNTGAFPTFQANNTNASTGAYAGQFIGGLITSGKNALSSGYAFRAQNNLSTDLFTVRNDGNVGIGTNAPSANLHVNGTTRLVDGTQAAGKVLTSDASGNASWRSSPAAVVYTGLNNTAVTVGTTATPLGTPTMTFTKVYSNTEVMVSLHSRIFSGNFIGASIVSFEIYIDGLATTAGPVHPLLNTSSSAYVSISSIFSGLSVGAHTVTIIGKTDTGTSTSVLVDSGGLGGKVIIKEIF